MGQATIFDWRTPDATLTLNFRDQAIVPPGVYAGYNLRLHPTLGQLVLEHDPNPNAFPTTGGGTVSGLGLSNLNNISVLRTRDGVTCIEAGGIPLSTGGVGYDILYTYGAAGQAGPSGVANGAPILFNVQWDISNGGDRIDYVVARYTYIGQTSTPPRVIYAIVEGTVAGQPPSIQNNEIVLAEIRIKAGTDQFNAAQAGRIRLTNVAKKNLDNSLVRVGETLAGFLRPGVYYGYDPSYSGYTVSLTGGGYLAGDGTFSKDPATAVTLPSGGNMQTAGYVPTGSGARHVTIFAVNNPDTDAAEVEAPEYLMVSPTGGTVATDAEILAAAQTVYSSITASHITVLAIARVRTGGIEAVSRSERLALPDELVVTDGVFHKNSSYRVGSAGLRFLLDLVWNATKQETVPRRHRIITDGAFFHDSDLVIPSNVELTGFKSHARHVFSSALAKFDASGITDRNVPVTVSAASATPPAAGEPVVPGGYTLTRITITTALDYAGRKFSHRDPVRIYNLANNTTVEGYYYRSVSPVAFDAVFAGGTLPDGSIGADVQVLKSSVGLSNCSIETGELRMHSTNVSSIGLVVAESAVLGYNMELMGALLAVKGSLSDVSGTTPSAGLKGVGNRINRVDLLGVPPGSVGASWEGSLIEGVYVRNSNSSFTLRGKANVVHNVYGKLVLDAEQSLVGMVHAPTPPWDYAVVVGANSLRSTVLKKVGNVDNSLSAGKFNQIGAASKVIAVGGEFNGYDSGTVIDLAAMGEWLEPLTLVGGINVPHYRAVVTPRDDTPGAVLTDYGIALIGQVWTEAHESGSLVVKNSGWQDGVGPTLTENVAVTGAVNYTVQLQGPVVAGATVVSAKIGGTPYTSDDSGGSFTTGTPGITAVALNTTNWQLSITASSAPEELSVSYQVGPWTFDCVIVQDA